MKPQPPRSKYKSRSYIKAGQPSTKDFVPQDEIVAVPKSSSETKEQKSPKQEA